MSKNRLMLSLVFAFVVSGLMFNFASAATMNSHPRDFDTLRVGNVTRNPGTNSSVWGTTTYANSGDVLSFAIYYHNSTSQTARNVRVYLTPDFSESKKVHTFEARVSADNMQVAHGSATVIFNEPTAIEFREGSVIWRPDQQTSGSRNIYYGQVPRDIFGSNGINLGDVAPGWSSQGNVMVGFRALGNTTYSNLSDYISTITLLPKNVTQTSATFEGSVSSDYSSADLWFEWGTSPSLGNKTGSTSTSLNGSSKKFSFLARNLAPGVTYYYKAVAKSGLDISYGGVMSFRTDGVVANNSYNYGYRDVIIEKEVENLTHPNGTSISTQAERGDLIKFTITVTNTGDKKLSDLEVRDRVSNYLSFVNESQRINEKDMSKKAVWDIGSLSVGQRKVLVLETIVTSDAQLVSLIKNGGNNTVVESGSLLRTSNEVFVSVVDKVGKNPVKNNEGSAVGGNTAGLVFTDLRTAFFLILIALFSAILYFVYKISQK